MENNSAERPEDRRQRLASMLRSPLAEWDAGAELRIQVRPDGKMDMTVVSGRFEGLDSREREEAFWPALGPVSKPEMIYLTYCLLLTPGERAQSFGGEPQANSAENWDE